MSSKPFKSENINKKRLVITSNQKQFSNYHTVSSLNKIVPQNQELRLQQNKQSQKENQCHHLPPISSLSHLRFSVVLPSEAPTRQRSSTVASTKKLPSSSKLRPSCFLVNSKITSTKIEDVVSQFINDSLQRNIFHLRFGKFLIQPKNLNNILLFALSQFNNSTNIAHFHKNMANPNAYEALLRDLENDEFRFKFGLRINKKLLLSPRIIDLKCENEYRANILSQGQMLANKNQNLLCDIMQRRREKEQVQKEIERDRTSVKQLKDQMDRLNAEIMRLSETVQQLNSVIKDNQDICQRLEEKKHHYATFLINFNENKYNQMAVASKRLEEELFQYVEYLNFHRRNYEKSKHSSEIERRISNQLQQFCRYLLEDHVSTIQKPSTTKDFMQKINQEYTSIINQLHAVIQEKTSFITDFMRIITNWHSNYLSKKDILHQLGNIISYENINLEEVKIAPLGWGKPTRQASFEREEKIISIAEKIINIFSIASSFF